MSVLQSTLFIPTLDTTTKFVIMIIRMSRNLRTRGDSFWEIMPEYCIKTSSHICFGYLLESPHWGNSNKYPKHMLYEEMRIKYGLPYISFCPLIRILYNSKFILMATSLGTNVVVVTRVHWTSLSKYKSLGLTIMPNYDYHDTIRDIPIMILSQ